MTLCTSEPVSSVSSEAQDQWQDCPALVIAGMHRSGTSLAANLLQSAGVNVGKSLIGPHSSNPKGHFENRDFVHFHQRILRALSLNEDGFVTQSRLPITEEFAAEAAQIAQTNATGSVWGFKDPRSVLFLESWESLLPAAKFLFVYRSPWEVVSSLFRRGDATIVGDPGLALKVWRNYMEAILQFVSTRKDKCLLLHVGQFVDEPAQTVRFIGQHFDLQLQSPEPDVVEKSFMTTNEKLLFAERMVRESFPDIYELWLRVNEAADMAAPFTSSPVNDREAVARDWLTICQLDSANRRLSEELRAERQKAAKSAEDAEIHISELNEAIARLQQREAEILNSQSWRITGPLRKLRRFLG